MYADYNTRCLENILSARKFLDLFWMDEGFIFGRFGFGQGLWCNIKDEKLYTNECGCLAPKMSTHALYFCEGNIILCPSVSVRHSQFALSQICCFSIVSYIVYRLLLLTFELLGNIEHPNWLTI